MFVKIELSAIDVGWFIDGSKTEEGIRAEAFTSEPRTEWSIKINRDIPSRNVSYSCMCKIYGNFQNIYDLTISETVEELLRRNRISHV